MRSTRTDEVDKHTIFPYVHSFSNNPNNEALIRPITIPDVLPSSLPDGSEFSLVAGTPPICSAATGLLACPMSDPGLSRCWIGDFEEIYGSHYNDPDEPQSGQWDAVLTCFFIDTVRTLVVSPLRHLRADFNVCCSSRRRTSSTTFASSIASLHPVASGST